MSFDQCEAIFPVTNNNKASIPPSEVSLVSDPKSHQQFYWIRINVNNCIRNPTGQEQRYRCNVNVMYIISCVKSLLSGNLPDSDHYRELCPDSVSINRVPCQPDPDLNDFALRIHLSEPAWSNLLSMYNTGASLIPYQCHVVFESGSVPPKITKKSPPILRSLSEPNHCILT